ncbi:hypothetical protein CONLIGDRAFT_231386 [Coniochaeta ligniaria NRRL 30616]|uniref:Uncharacterized protein n=1 Tax=Coniochaeta ligniaria NRRL 30616 TaxID=1408157 RepID=A0A1J7JE44_9PEZI|nr:hypothetical protein CONLIGDRAFT_231386 [Coniochaeta ligniaria NRRL 30616]
MPPVTNPQSQYTSERLGTRLSSKAGRHSSCRFHINSVPQQYVPVDYLAFESNKQDRKSRNSQPQRMVGSIHVQFSVRVPFRDRPDMETSSRQGVPASDAKISLPRISQGSGFDTSQDAHELDAQRLCGRAPAKTWPISAVRLSGQWDVSAVPFSQALILASGLRHMRYFLPGPPPRSLSAPLSTTSGCEILRVSVFIHSAPRDIETANSRISLGERLPMTRAETPVRRSSVSARTSTAPMPPRDHGFGSSKCAAVRT